MIKCRRCEKHVRRSMIVSHAEQSEYYNICGPCAGEMDAEQLRQDAQRQKHIRERNARISSKIQKATEKAQTPAEVREQTRKIITEAELRDRAREELAVRELCRRSLLDYIYRFKSNYQAGWVHRVICRKLEKFLDDVINKRSPRLMLFMPPRHGKSEIVSDKFPTWSLGKYPHLEIMLASYAVTLATGFSKVNRDRIRDPVYQQIFPKTKIDPDEQGAELWKTTQRGGFLAAGVGGPITGRGADIFIVDDPVKNYEEAESETIRESIKNWWRSTARTRLSPGGGVLVVQCMTGDTPVLMGDGVEKPLRDVRPGDTVATYDEGSLTTAKVLNWASQGRDSVYRITTSSGKMVRANARHPFLVYEHGELKWVRVRDLRLTQRIVTVKGNGGSGKARLAAPRDANNPLFAEGSAASTTTSGNGLLGIVRRLHARIRAHALARSSNTAMESHSTSTRGSWLSKMGDALFAVLRLLKLTTPSTGLACSALTTATIPMQFEGYSATGVTSSWGETPRQSCLNRPQRIFEYDTIEGIEPAGVEEVFDIQVERTENFIADALVTHNTRWHDDDLSGFLEREYIEGKKEGIPESELEQFEIVTFPAIAEENEYVDQDWNFYHEHDIPEGRKVLQVREPGDPLHPARYGAAYLNQSRRSMGDRMFGALYQQNPIPESGDFFRTEDFRYYNEVPHIGPRPIYFAWDLAMSQRQSGDFSVGVAAMFHENGDVYVLEMLRGRWRTAELIDRMVGLVERYKRNAAKLGVEQGVIWNSIQDEFFKQLHARGAFVSIDDSLRPMTDKRVRARPLQAWMQAGKLKFPTAQPWVEQARAELLRFDAGVNDDVVDTLAWLVRMLQNEAVPDIDRLRRGQDRFYVNKEKMISDYMRNQQGVVSEKRFMSS